MKAEVENWCGPRSRGLEVGKRPWPLYFTPLAQFGIAAGVIPIAR